jgi:hypothetical protein
VLRLAHLTTLGGIFASAFSAAAPSAADLAHCAGIADPAARLACYDAISGNKSDGRPTAASPPGAPAPAAPAPALPPAPAAATFSSNPDNFGFTEAQRAPAAARAAPQAITARIAKIVDTPLGQSYAVLDNGQTWVFIDSDQDAGLRPQDPITIKRGTLGAFLLITSSHHSYHVKRTK